MAEFLQRYPHGFLIFGLAENGEPLVYNPQLKDLRIDVDWRDLRVAIDPSSNTIKISTPSIRFVFAEGD